MNYVTFVKEFRSRIGKKLGQKTSWGRVEIEIMIDRILLEIAAEALDQKEFPFALESG